MRASHDPNAVLIGLLQRLERAALATGLRPGEFRLASKVTAAGETHVGIVIVPTARGFTPISIP